MAILSQNIPSHHLWTFSMSNWHGGDFLQNPYFSSQIIIIHRFIYFLCKRERKRMWNVSSGSFWSLLEVSQLLYFIYCDILTFLWPNRRPQMNAGQLSFMVILTSFLPKKSHSEQIAALLLKSKHDNGVSSKFSLTLIGMRYERKKNAYL